MARPVGMTPVAVMSTQPFGQPPPVPPVPLDALALATTLAFPPPVADALARLEADAWPPPPPMPSPSAAGWMSRIPAIQRQPESIPRTPIMAYGRTEDRIGPTYRTARRASLSLLPAPIVPRSEALVVDRGIQRGRRGW